MKTITFNPIIPQHLLKILGHATGFGLLWWLLPQMLRYISPLSGTLDPGIWQVVLLATGCWLMLLTMTRFLLKTFIVQIIQWLELAIGNPLQTLTPWQQYVYYLACYALVLFSGIGCLLAIC